MGGLELLQAVRPSQSVTETRAPHVGATLLRIAVVCQGLPHPTQGASLVIYHNLIRGLVEAQHSVRLVILDSGPGGIDSRALGELVDAMTARGTFSAVSVRGFPQVQSRISGLRIDPQFTHQVRDEIVQFAPDVVLCLDWIPAAVTVTVDVPRVVWLGDLQFETLPWHTRFSIEEGSRRYDRLLLLPRRVRQLERLYYRILAGAKVIVAAKSSEETLAALGIPSRYLPYPWPAQTYNGPVQAKPRHPTFLFSGTLQALGSRAAFHALFREVYPRARKIFGAGEFAILVTGLGELPAWVAAEISTKPEIKFLGYVDDLSAVMAICDAFIAPIDVPVGNRTRILTCMGAGLPVVAHSFTALGNPLLRDGETCLLAAEPDRFVEKMADVARGQETARMIALKARAAYLDSHAPEAANFAMMAYLSEVVSER